MHVRLSRIQEVTSVLFNRLLHITQLMIKNIDKNFSKNPHGRLSSTFILLRFSCLICLTTSSSSANKKPSNDEVRMLKSPSPILSFGDHTTPLVSSMSSHTSSSKDDDMGTDLSDEVMSSPSVPVINNTSQWNNKKFLHHDLFMKGSSQCACLGNNEFWKTVFASTVNLLREKLGWDEKTPELYHRYIKLV